MVLRQLPQHAIAVASVIHRVLEGALVVVAHSVKAHVKEDAVEDAIQHARLHALEDVVDVRHAVAVPEAVMDA